MQLLKAINKRRSCRKFTKKKPDWKDIFDALDTTRMAPMAGGYFTLNFLLTDEKEKIKEIAKWSEQDFIAETKYIIVFISDPQITKNLYGERGKIYMHQQAGAAAQNFMLALTEKKLSTCWIGQFNEEKIKKILRIPDNQKIEAIFPIGYEREKPRIRKIQAELYNRIHYYEWGNKRMRRIQKIEHYAPTGYYKV